MKATQYGIHMFDLVKFLGSNELSK